MYIVYAKTDEKNRIISVNSSAFLSNPTGWFKIDEGYGDKYHHAQGNYFEKPLVDNRGLYRYKLVAGEAIERTQEEIDADYIEPTKNLTYEERISELETQNAMLTECLLEMSEIVYS